MCSDNSQTLYVYPGPLSLGNLPSESDETECFSSPVVEENGTMIISSNEELDSRMMQIDKTMLNQRSRNGKMRYLDFSKIVSDNQKAIDCLREMQLLHRTFYCCNTECSLVSDVYGSSDKI